MSILRSETIQRFDLYLPRQSAWTIMNKLGQHEHMHIIRSKQEQMFKPFTQQIKRIDEAVQKVDLLENVLLQKKLIKPINHINKREQMKHFLDLFGQFYHDNGGKNGANLLNSVIENVQQLWEYYTEVNQRIEMLDKEITIARQNIAVLMAGQKQYGKGFFSTSKERPRLQDHFTFQYTNKLNYKTGVIRIHDQLRFKRTVFRISKGNCLIMTKKFQQILSQINDNQYQKVVFFVIYPANNQTYFDKKLTKLISTFCDRNFDYSSIQQGTFDEVLSQHRKTLSEAIGLKRMCENQLQIFLNQKVLQDVRSKQKSFYSRKKYQFLKFYLIKERQIYAGLNEMQDYKNFLKAQVFIRKQDIKRVHEILNTNLGRQLPPGKIVPVEPTQKIPTSFVLNDFTRPAQQIVQTYGVPRYKQVNPSLFTNITFPFLFGVMFGDIGHGLIVFLFGIFLVWKYQKLLRQNNPILNMLLPYRYLITLMGFFATYCGFVYNDFLSMSLNLFGSCYQVDEIYEGLPLERLSNDCTYPFGIDPVWSVANNSLNFTNSLKMKISVIIGVLHMTLGVILKAYNEIYFKNFKDLLFVFTSQITFLLLFFGYMDFLIIYKWLMPWGIERDTKLAPSIVGQMIAIPLSMGSTQGKPLWDEESQQSLQYAILIIGAICVPLMLFPVPLMKIFKIERKNLAKKIKKVIRSNQYRDRQGMEKDIRQALIQSQHSENSQEIQQQRSLHRNHKCIFFVDIKELEEEQSPSEIFVHQIIETIEFVLGSVSNTASYLRLWALSLAHSQLSQVFFEKTVQQSLQIGWSGILMNLIGFCILASTTAGIMLLMDTMECFLHTLRLHWVEFQNKFYKGDGYSFKSFNFKSKINEHIKQTSQKND